MQAITNDSGTEESLKDFLRDYPKEARLLGHFAGVSDATVQRWKSGVNYPIGLSLLAVRNFLALKGYKIPVFDELDPKIRDFGSLVVFRIITVKEAVKDLGYSSNMGLFRLVFGKNAPMGDRPAKIQGYLDVYGDDLVVKRASANVGVRMTSSSPQVSPPASTTPVHKPVCLAGKGLSDHEAVITALAHLILAAKPLADLLNSEQFSDAERAEFRRLVGDKGMFNFSNVVNWLCTADTRNKHFLRKS